LQDLLFVTVGALIVAVLGIAYRRGVVGAVTERLNGAGSGVDR
jgi:hypothetical protein